MIKLPTIILAFTCTIEPSRFSCSKRRLVFNQTIMLFADADWDSSPSWPSRTTTIPRLWRVTRVKRPPRRRGSGSFEQGFSNEEKKKRVDETAVKKRQPSVFLAEIETKRFWIFIGTFVVAFCVFVWFTLSWLATSVRRRQSVLDVVRHLFCELPD